MVDRFESGGLQITAVESVSSSEILGISVGFAFVLLVVGALGFLYCRRKKGSLGGHKKLLTERPITLRRPTAVRNPSPHSHYLKKTPSPTGPPKTPPGGGKSLDGGKSSSSRSPGNHSPPLPFPSTRSLSSPKGVDKPEDKQGEQGKKTSAVLDCFSDSVSFENEKMEKVTTPSKEEQEMNEKNKDMMIETKLGKLFFRTKYSFEKSTLVVTILRCTDLPAKDSTIGSSDPYVKLQLLPEKQHKAKTRVLRKTLNPVYDEEFTFYGISEAQLQGITLHFVILSFDRYSRDDVIGEVISPLSASEFDNAEEKWISVVRNINPRSLKIRSQGRGELLLSLCHQPAASRLTVVVLKARNLPKMDITGLSDPYVKIYLLYNGQRIAKKKTHVKKRTLNPVFNESFVFELPSGAEGLKNVSLELLLLDWDRVTKNEVIGRLELGGGTKANSSAQHHWAEVVSSPRRQIAEWHKLRD